MDTSRPRSSGLRILTLDGGDARCMSELYLLHEYMYRLERRRGIQRRPCDYFDLIIGSGAAGCLAALLVLFGMSVEEAQDAFFKIYTSVFDRDTICTPEARATRLRAAISELLETHDISLDTIPSDVTRGGGCKVAICYSPAVRMDFCGMFRNYQHPQQHNVGATILEAICASWAIPDHIASIHIGPQGRQEELLSATTAFNNPTQVAIKEIESIFGSESHISCLLSLGSGQHGVVSVDDMMPASRMQAARIAMESERIDEDIRRRIGDLRVYYRFSVDIGLDDHSTFGAMKSHVDGYLAKDSVSKSLDECIVVSEDIGRVAAGKIYRSRISGVGTSHGLPPLSAFFVPRKEPMKIIEASLLSSDGERQRIAVISGIGGIGKTQLALKFARVHEDRFRYILFIDASSEQSIRRDMVDQVRRLLFGHNVKDFISAILLLQVPDTFISTNWFMIFDNADSFDVDIKQYFPKCDHGTILITSRNDFIGNLAPGSHTRLDIMSQEEGVEALLSSIFPGYGTRRQSATVPTARDREAAVGIVEELGRLPIAIIQAGCYIKQHQCLHDYLSRLNANRADILQRPTPVHLDNLKYPHSVYAAFDVTLGALSTRARDFLRILSFFHHSNIPRTLFAVAATTEFSFNPYDLLDRGPEFKDSIQFLTSMLWPEKTWKETQLDGLLEELQRYSLITLVHVHAIIALRLHPLTHTHIQDQIPPTEASKYSSAATRLLICGTTFDYQHHWEYLIPHFNKLLDGQRLHVNDEACLTYIHPRLTIPAIDIWKRIHDDVEKVHGTNHIRTSCAALQLAITTGQEGGEDEAVLLKIRVLKQRKALLGTHHLETDEARASLARTLRYLENFPGAEKIQRGILRRRMRTHGQNSPYTAREMSSLATTLACLYRFKEAQSQFMTAIEIWTKTLGRFNTWTIYSMEQLAQCHAEQSHYQEALSIKIEILNHRKLTQGYEHLDTLGDMEWIARLHRRHGHYEDAAAVLQQVLEVRKATQGPMHSSTLNTMHQLGAICLAQELNGEAEQLWKEELDLRKARKDPPNVIIWLIEDLEKLFRKTGRREEEEAMRQEVTKIYEEEVVRRITHQAPLHPWTHFIEGEPPQEAFQSPNSTRPGDRAQAGEGNKSSTLNDNEEDSDDDLDELYREADEGSEQYYREADDGLSRQKHAFVTKATQTLKDEMREGKKRKRGDGIPKRRLLMKFQAKIPDVGQNGVHGQYFASHLVGFRLFVDVLLFEL